jgi:hypothetical protein
MASRHKKSRSFAYFVFYLIISLILGHSQANAQFIPLSWYTLIKDASDIVIIKVNHIEGKEYGKKAVVHIERSFKGTVQSDTIELPFVYASWPVGNGAFESVTETIQISFKTGERYVALIQKWHKGSNPYAAETQYEVIDYPKATLFTIKDNNDPELREMEQLLDIAN